MFASLKNRIKEETGSDVARRSFPVKAGHPMRQSDPGRQAIARQVAEQGVQTEDEEGALVAERKERQHALQLQERDREWQEKVRSLQNSMQAAQAVWSGEAAAARRELRDEVRKNTSLLEQLELATNAATRAQDKLDSILEDIETERRNWALERIKLSSATEDALHRLSLAEIQCDSNSLDSKEIALKRKLEETQLHLHDIKTSWSGQIASLETQVGRLSRQAGEEGAERRRIEKERDSLQEKLREKELQLEQAQATLEDKEAKMGLLAAEAGDIARTGREARNDALQQRDISNSLKDSLTEMEIKLHNLENNCKKISLENEELKNSITEERNINSSLKMEIEALHCENKKNTNSKCDYMAELAKQKIANDKTESLLQTETKSHQDALTVASNLNDQIKELKKDLNDIHNICETERHDKDEALMRNAHMSQTLEIYKQEMRQQDMEIVDLKEKIASLQKSVTSNFQEQSEIKYTQEQKQEHQKEIDVLKSERDNALTMEQKLQENIKGLNLQVAEKSKSIRILQNKLSDMRKTLQREFKSSGHVDPLGSSVVEGTTEDPDVSKKYLKHVLIKFLTSREIEARQLTKAVGALLDLSEQEESLLRETLGWRNGFTAWLTPSHRNPNS